LTEKKRYIPLRIKIVCLILCSTLVAVGVYYVCSSIGYNEIDRTYMSSSASNSRVRVYLAKFQTYVRENNLSSKDLDSIAQWTKEAKYVHLLIFKDNQARAEASYNGASSLTGTKYETYYEAVRGDYSFTPITFSDGIFQVSLDDFSYTRYYTLCNIISLIMAFLVIFVSVISYINRLSGRIIKLSSAAQEIENGNLEYDIPSSGSDEVSRLASGMDSMRISVQERIKSESAARQANTDLIAAISHDIRTPLTTLIGYLELLQGGAYSSDEQRAQYVDIAHEKAMRLKELTDELFRYFLVFSQTEIPVKVEDFDGEILLEQLFGEHIIELRASGWTVIVNPIDAPCTVSTDAMCLKHVLDNVFSNVKKHGDNTKPVIVLARIEGDGKLHMSVTNSVPDVPNKVESTRVGLRTCEKMMQTSGGEFHTSCSGEKFVSELVVPVKK
jgi:signal transduction histidine kinase